MDSVYKAPRPGPDIWKRFNKYSMVFCIQILLNGRGRIRQSKMFSVFWSLQTGRGDRR